MVSYPLWFLQATYRHCLLAWACWGMVGGVRGVMLCTQWRIHVCACLFFNQMQTEVHEVKLKFRKCRKTCKSSCNSCRFHNRLLSFIVLQFIWQFLCLISSYNWPGFVFNIHVLCFLFIFKCHLACWKYHSIECCDSEKRKYTEVWWEDFAMTRKRSTLWCFFVYAMLFNMFFHYLISVFVVSIRGSQPGGQKPLEGLSMLLRGPQDDLYIC